MKTFDPESDPHRRFNPLTGQYVLVSPHRTKRPWQGQTEVVTREGRPPHDPTCYLCPGNRRAQSEVNPPYEGTFVFDNDFSALLPDQVAVEETRAPGQPAQDADDLLLRVEPVAGRCRVICFSPRHDLSLPEMEVADIVRVINTWADESASLGTVYRWVQVFENKGAVMGCSNPHPHGQIWASDAVPNEPAVEDRQQRSYLQTKGGPLLLDYVRRELSLGTRVVHESKRFVAVVPFWAIWPFETLILPKEPVTRMPELTEAARLDLAGFLRALLRAYDRLFDVSFPYSMGWHGAPFDDQPADHWQLHAHIYPPLLRSASVKKFMVGYEMLGEPQRDLTPEQAARRLRALVIDA